VALALPVPLLISFCFPTKESENKLLTHFFCKKKGNIRFFLIGKKESKNSFTIAFFLKSNFLEK